jgi:hypothetical protein
VKTPSDKRSVVRPIRFTERQDRLLKQYAAIIAAETGQQVTLTWVIQTMMELGKQEFERRYINPEYPEVI